MADNSKGKTDQRPKRRSIFGMHQLRRGRDRKWLFYGQEDDEVVRLVIRKNWTFLVKESLPFFLSIPAFAVVLLLNEVFPDLRTLWWFIDGVAFLLVLALGIRFVYEDGLVWWNDIYIITNKRVIKYEGFLQPKRQIVPLDKIQQIGIELEQPWGYLFKYGTIHLYLTGGDLIIEDIGNPRRIRDAIEGITNEFKEGKPKDPPIPMLKDPVLATALAELAKPKEVPKLENEDEERYGPPRDPAARLRPRRTFGAFLRIPCEVHYTSGEQTVKYVQRSRWVLLVREALPITLSLLVLLITFVVPSTGMLSESVWHTWQYLLFFLVPILGLWIFVVWANYVDDVYILTSKRIIDLERSFGVFGEERIEIEYKNIKDIQVKVSGPIEIILNIGTVTVETPGKNPDIIFHHVHDPFKLQDKINEIREFQEKAKKIKDENDQKKNLDKWFSTVFSNFETEVTVETRGVPDLKGKDLPTAIAIAQKHELDVSVLPDSLEIAGVPAGHIALQNPPTGTVMRKGSTIEVVLSGSPPYR